MKLKQVPGLLGAAFAGLLIGIAITLWCVWHFQAGGQIAKGVSAEGWRLLRPGLTVEDVTKIVGTPLYEDRTGAVMYGSDQRPLESSVTFVYATPGVFGSGWYLGANFLQGRLIYIWAVYNGFVTYRCTDLKCPEIADERGNLSNLPVSRRQM